MGSLFSKINIVVLVISIILLGIGYLLLAQGPIDNILSIGVAPFILVGCYCIIIPIAIMLNFKKEE